MLIVIREAIASPNEKLPAVFLRAERLKLAKRVWRGAADDGQEFGFELPQPLKPGETIWETESRRYVVHQAPETLLEIGLDLLPPSAAAGLGWAVGNLHLELSAEPTRLLTPDETAARQLLDRLGISYRSVEAVFRPGRFSRGDKASPPAQELGPSHRH
jgi:urease accessory protein